MQCSEDRDLKVFDGLVRKIRFENHQFQRLRYSIIFMEQLVLFPFSCNLNLTRQLPANAKKKKNRGKTTG